MATDLANLQTRRSAVIAQLAAMGTTEPGGKPDAGGSGDSIKHVGYKDGLYRELKMLNELIDAATAESDGPWEVIS